MKKHVNILLPAIMLLVALPAFSQVQEDSASSSGWEVYASAGFGFSYNVYLEDTQNERADAYELIGYTEVKDDSKGSWLYGSFGLEPRYSTGNIVFGLPVSYYGIMESKRVLVNGGSTVETVMELKMWSASFAANYKISMDNSNYLLLGGGAGFYSGTIKWDDTLLGSDSDTKWTIGWHTGIEYHWVFGDVDLYIGATSRFAEILMFKVHSDDGKNNMIAGVTGLYFPVGAGYRF